MTMNMMDATALAREGIEAATGKPFESVSYCRLEGEHWVVGIEVLESKARLNDNDVIAEYEIAIDPEAKQMVRYTRLRRYLRGEAAAQVA